MVPFETGHQGLTSTRDHLHVTSFGHFNLLDITQTQLGIRFKVEETRVDAEIVGGDEEPSVQIQRVAFDLTRPRANNSIRNWDIAHLLKVDVTMRIGVFVVLGGDAVDVVRSQEGIHIKVGHLTRKSSARMQVQDVLGIHIFQLSTHSQSHCHEEALSQTRIFAEHLHQRLNRDGSCLNCTTGQCNRRIFPSQDGRKYSEETTHVYCGRVLVA
mmetsp:Transcript_32812/g.82350  ORF Transcript_32812/g.82350 Transcript_32812/m.82350 type:complete len:213 (-) Transcript_32812:1668-2306(-)